MIIPVVARKQPPMKLIHFSLCLVVVSLLLVGCADTPRNLKITEVSADRVELFLVEPSTNVELQLTHMKLRWISQDPNAQPVNGELDLGWAGPLRGQQFLVIHEGANYAGPPVAENFRPTTPGIKVRNGFFPGYIDGTKVSMSVDGRSPRGLFLIRLTTDVVNDIVRFGPIPRPTLAGAFNEDGTLNAIRPEGGRKSVSRRFSTSTPVDTNSEADWSLQDESIGVPTP